MQVPSVGGEDPLEEGMATHSSILAGTIPWTQEPVHGVTESDMTEQLSRHARVDGSGAEQSKYRQGLEVL